MSLLAELNDAPFFAGKTAKIYMTSKIYKHGASQVLRVRSLGDIGYKIKSGNEENFFHSQAKLASEVFMDLKKSYDFNIPDFSFSLEYYKKQWWVITIEDFIKGSSLFEIEIGDKVPFECIQKLVEGYARYIKDTYDNDSVLWNDFKSSQFMYGTNQSNIEDIYLVDLDPIVFKHPTKSLIDDASSRLGKFVEDRKYDYSAAEVKSLQKSLAILPIIDPSHSLSEVRSNIKDML